MIENTSLLLKKIFSNIKKLSEKNDCHTTAMSRLKNTIIPPTNGVLFLCNLSFLSGESLMLINFEKKSKLKKIKKLTMKKSDKNIIIQKPFYRHRNKYPLNKNLLMKSNY